MEMDDEDGNARVGDRPDPVIDAFEGIGKWFSGVFARVFGGRRTAEPSTSDLERYGEDLHLHSGDVFDWTAGGWLPTIRGRTATFPTPVPDEECGICHDAFQDGEVLLRCSNPNPHWFHGDCAQRWRISCITDPNYPRQPSCPLCRAVPFQRRVGVH